VTTGPRREVVVAPTMNVFLERGGETIIGRLPASVRIEAGERVGVQINPDRLRLFDQDTEVAV
jgi:hypothetical protein